MRGEITGQRAEGKRERKRVASVRSAAKIVVFIVVPNSSGGSFVVVRIRFVFACRTRQTAVSRLCGTEFRRTEEDYCACVCACNSGPRMSVRAHRACVRAHFGPNHRACEA